MNTNNIQNRLDICIHMDYPSFTDFLDLSVLIEIRRSLKIPKGYFSLEYCGFLDDERRMIGFFPDSYLDMIGMEECLNMFPVSLLQIEPSFKSDPMFGHRDILGTVLGLGLERKLFGDIMMSNRISYMLCHSRSSDIVLSELISVKHTHVTVKAIEGNNITKQLSPKVKELNMTVASLRLDGIVKGVSHCSRNEANSMIQAGLVKVNQIEINKNHKQVEKGDILSIRRKGKFKIKEIGKLTKKGRLAVTILKYI